MKSEVIKEIERERIIVISRKIPFEKISAVAQALADGGIRLLEVTFDHSSPEGRLETCRSIERLRERFEGRLLVGAGTVLSPEEVRDSRNAGASYIISPDSSRAVIEETAALGLVSIPGALTPSEIVSARSWGADFVKLFPAGELGIGYIRALLGPLGHIPMLAVGGVDEKNIGSFLKAGLKGVGVGSNILKADQIAAGDYAGITRLAALYRTAAEKER